MVPRAFKIACIDKSEGSGADRYQLMKELLKLGKE